ncbi:MAG: DNA polymerase II large subunit [Nitrososphaeria archaeon]
MQENVVSQMQQCFSLLKERVSLNSKYEKYYSYITDYLSKAIEIANIARGKGLDPAPNIETKIVFDLASRVEELIGLKGISKRLRTLLVQNKKEAAALILAIDVASGLFGSLSREEALDKGVRAGLAVVTDGVTVAPLQGISKVAIKKNKDGSQYASIYFAGPIRSAGGTDAAFTLVIANEVRKVLGLERYHVNDFDDEIGRFIEELRIYEREVGNFQFKVTDEDIKTALMYVPVEINGVETNPVEVIIHRNMKRIETNRVRGGALRVLNDGLIGRARKLEKLVKELSITDWNWLVHLKGGLQEAATLSHFGDVIAGRPILSYPGAEGGFRLRYGRCFNTGLATVGINPLTSVILDYALVVGTQIKIDKPGKSATVAFVDSIEGPVVKLNDGSVIKVEDFQTAEKVKHDIDKILFLGDILISFGDFIENNAILDKTAYVEELWLHDFIDACNATYGNITVASQSLDVPLENILNWINNPNRFYPNFDLAYKISKTLNIPLHPRYLFFWDLLKINEVIILRNALRNGSKKDDYLIISYDENVKKILEKLCVPHKVENALIVFERGIAKILDNCLGLNREAVFLSKYDSVLDLISFLSGVPIKNKVSTFIGVRVGRPEKAEERRMKPPVHLLFPVGSFGGSSRDLVKASEKTVCVPIINRLCPKCSSSQFSSICKICKSPTIIVYTCPSCGNTSDKNEICPKCKIYMSPYSQKVLDLKKELSSASEKVDYKPVSPLKGVKGLMNDLKQPEPIEKGLLRQKYNLQIYRDGTIRFDATNMPLTSFLPNTIITDYKELVNLGYDLNELSSGRPVPIYVQDVILPKNAAKHLINVAKFIDELLEKFYNVPSFYKVKEENDLIGHLIVGIAPHTSVAIVGRIIGFSNSQVCLAHPFWHSAKRRDCDGDADSITLLLDVLLNFSLYYVPSQIGGLMDTPLLLQPYIIPSEVEDQSLSIDSSERYPRDFYEKSYKSASAREVASIPLIKNLLAKKEEYLDLKYNYDTKSLFLSKERNSLATAPSFIEKIEKQFHYEMMIKAVSFNEAIVAILTTHLLPDILGNLKAFGSQKVRCKKCGEKYRRIPLKGICIKCGGELQLSVTKKSVGKFLELAERLASNNGVPSYVKMRVELAKEDFESLFGKEQKQATLTDFI